MSDQPIVPLGQWLFVSRVKKESIIALPDNAKDDFEQGDIVAAGPYMPGPDGRYVDSVIKPGHRVVFRGLRNDEMVDYGGEKLILMKAADVVGIVNPEA